jgi:tetratricopeptide (TPR) repeat protein
MYHSIAVHMKHIGKDDEAIKYYKKSIELNPMAFLSYVGLGEIEMDRKNYEKAEEYFMQALKIKSELKTDQADYMIKQNLIKAKIQKEMDLLEKAEKETDKTNIERSFK